MTKKTLDTYRRKRQFGKTPEPAGAEAPAGKPSGIFVVQKHRATSLHYDFRIEVGGVLKSWAVPKGPSTNPADKRLAMPTEDHPLEYASFEGVIPEGQYGAGAVIVWDAGHYRNIKADDQGHEMPMEQCLDEGQVEIHLDGVKLKGAYALIRTAADKSGRYRWLLIKKRDSWAGLGGDLTVTRPESVLSQRTIEDMSASK
ncbi:MAG: DNA polymerase ligase N-terminal domain-containing protein [Phycisphaerae bacterium]|jgi:DNA ligase D-like protein (predicted 3'-phosphoesterase)